MIDPCSIGMIVLALRVACHTKAVGQLGIPFVESVRFPAVFEMFMGIEDILTAPLDG